jgi:putative addiction module killer protein
VATQPREIERYVTADGQIPFDNWFDSIRVSKTQTIISKRLDRVRMGNLGDYRSVGGGVFELRIDYGRGYCIYFGQVGTTIVLLLCGGDKSTQIKDIRQAQEYWRDYRS